MAEYEGMDALMAAITDEPVPEEAHDDAEFMAEHRAAVADVALLRAQLTALGDAWAEQGRKGSRPHDGLPGSAPAARNGPRGTVAAVP